jgi:hypothetical protein
MASEQERYFACNLLEGAEAAAVAQRVTGSPNPAAMGCRAQAQGIGGGRLVKTCIRTYTCKQLIVLDAHGRLDLEASKQAIRELTSEPGYSRQYEILADLREVRCDLSVIDVFEIALYLAWPGRALPQERKIAILVPENTEFDNARFLALCARN